jgi:hypothetical protein
MSAHKFVKNVIACITYGWTCKFVGTHQQFIVASVVMT